MTVEIPVSADLDIAGLNAKLAAFTRSINAMGEQIARAGRVRFEPISRASLDMARQYEATLRNIGRLDQGLARRLKATGQENLPPEQWQWERLYGDPAQRIRAQQRLFTLATGRGFSPLPPTAGGVAPTYRDALATAPAAPGGGMRAAFADTMERAMRAGGAPGQIAAAGLRGGRVAASEGTGLGGSILSGIGAGLGFAAVQGITALISRIAGAVSAAQEESIGSGDLYRRTGGTGPGRSFYSLRDRLRGSARALDIGFNESVGLAGMAARRGNITDAADLARMVEVGGGFARGYGFDPATGVSAFTGLRGANVVRNPEEATRLGLAIATGIARAGVFARAEDYLAEIASYGETSARYALQRTSLEGFGGALSALTAMRLPGLDVRGAAGLLNQADSALRGGGAAGEPSQAFLYQLLGRELGLSPIAVEMLQQGGLFASPDSTFGPDTVAGDFYRANGLGTPGAGDRTTNFERVMRGLRSRYGNRPELLAHAAGRFFGTNYAQSMALLRLSPEEMQGIGGFGFSPEQIAGLRPEAIGTLGRITGAGAGDLDAIAAELGGRTGSSRLAPGDAEALRRARARAGTGDPEAVEELRQIVARLTAAHGIEENEGTKTRQTVVGVQNSIQELASTVVPIFNTMRDALLALAGRAMGLTGAATPQMLAGLRAGAEHDQANAADRQELLQARDAAAADIERLQRGLDTERNPDRSRQMREAMRDARARHSAATEGLAALDRARAAAVRSARSGPPIPGSLDPMPRITGAGGHAEEVARFNEAVRPHAERVAAELGIPVETVLGHWALETRNGTAFAGRNNIGNLTAAPHQDATVGGDTDAAGRRITQRFRNFGSLDEFSTAYVDWVRRHAPGAMGQTDPAAYARALQAGRYATSPTFAAGLAATAGRFAGMPGAQATPLPPGTTPPGMPGAALQGTITGEVRIVDQRGVPIAPPAQVSGQLSPARPHGATMTPAPPGSPLSRAPAMSRPAP